MPWDDLLNMTPENYFIYIMTCENDTVVKATAKYVYICLQKRANSAQHVDAP